MAKAKPIAEAAPASTHTSIDIHKTQFSIPAPYVEGHIMSAIEAAVLNRTFAENIGNNFRDKVAKAKKESGDLLSQEAHATLQAAITEYASAYTFQGRRVAGPRLDNVTRIALSLAREAVKALLRKQGKDPKNFAKEAIEAAAMKALEKHPHFKAEAERRIREGNVQIEGILDDLPVAQAAE